MKRTPVPIGSFGDFPEWVIEYDHLVSIEYETPCPHCSVEQAIVDGEAFVKCPRVAIVKNEGGFNSTALCIDCAFDAAGKTPC